MTVPHENRSLNKSILKAQVKETCCQAVFWRVDFLFALLATLTLRLDRYCIDLIARIGIRLTPGQNWTYDWRGKKIEFDPILYQMEKTGFGNDFVQVVFSYVFFSHVFASINALKKIFKKRKKKKKSDINWRSGLQDWLQKRKVAVLYVLGNRGLLSRLSMVHRKRVVMAVMSRRNPGSPVLEEWFIELGKVAAYEVISSFSPQISHLPIF